MDEADNARLQAQAATNTRCKWGGGNDYLACRTCGLEYDYRKEERPACGAEATITRLQARVAELEAAQRWQSIESAPKDGTEILTVGIDSEHVVATKWLSPGPYVRTPNRNFYKDEGWYWSGWDGAVGPVRPTIWRPLPAPPVGDR
jgi:hypothetical protein